MTDFELRVMRRIANDSPITGHGMVAWVATARRLEKRGWTDKSGTKWRLTRAGETFLAREENYQRLRSAAIERLEEFNEKDDSD